MSKTQVVTLRVPIELKKRLESEAHLQGVSMNSLANYLLTTQISQLESLSTIEARMAKKSYSELKNQRLWTKRSIVSIATKSRGFGLSRLKAVV